MPVAETDTRIFRSYEPGGPRAFPPDALATLVAGLRRLSIDPVYIGEWIYLRGHEFDQIVHERISGD